MRAGPPAAEGRTRPRPFRGSIMGRPAPTRLDGGDRLRLPAEPPPSPGEGEKESPARRLSRACRRSDRPSWTSCSRPFQPDVHAAERGSSISCRSSAMMSQPSIPFLMGSHHSRRASGITELHRLGRAQDAQDLGDARLARGGLHLASSHGLRSRSDSACGLHGAYDRRRPTPACDLDASLRRPREGGRSRILRACPS